MDTTGVLTIAGFALGYALAYYTSKHRRLERTFNLEREMLQGTIKQLRARLRNYEQPPRLQGSVDIGDIERILGVKLPSWAKQLVQPYIEELAKNPDKLKEILQKFQQTAGQKAEGQQPIYEVWGE